MKRINWLKSLVVVAGLWELVSPFALGYSTITVAMWNAVVIGIVLIVLGAWAALYSETKTSRILDWINAILGVWLVVSPFALAYSTAATAMWNNIIAGLVVLVLAGWSAFVATREVSPQA